MHDVLNDLGRCLQQFLETALPTCDPHWWERRVLDRLTFQQRRIVEEKGITSLAKLDLAGLLRVLDQNWVEIGASRSLAFEARNWLKESQAIRNRWAHAPTGGFDDDTLYRDLDTMERLLQTLGATPDVLIDIRQRKSRLLANMAAEQQPAAQLQVVAALASGQFVPGSVVRLKAQPTITGAVVTHLPGELEDRYQVFHDGSIATYYATQIEPVVAASARASVAPDALHAVLSALQLRHPSTSNLYSLFASRIHFVPYQFRPVLKLIQDGSSALAYRRRGRRRQDH